MSDPKQPAAASDTVEAVENLPPSPDAEAAAFVAEARSTTADVLGCANGAPEAVSEDSRLATYREQFAALPDSHKNGFTWEQVLKRLSSPENAVKLQKALAMQGGGHLYFVDSSGEVSFRDGGVEPVIYGWDKAEGEKGRQLVQIYGRDPERMAKVKTWANGFEIEARVAADGYELFEDDGNYRFSDDMKRAAAVNGDGLFVASASYWVGKKKWRDSLLRNVRYAHFDSSFGHVSVRYNNPVGRYGTSGVVRRLSI